MINSAVPRFHGSDQRRLAVGSPCSASPAGTSKSLFLLVVVNLSLKFSPDCSAASTCVFSVCGAGQGTIHLSSTSVFAMRAMPQDTKSACCACM